MIINDNYILSSTNISWLSMDSFSLGFSAGCDKHSSWLRAKQTGQIVWLEVVANAESLRSEVLLRCLLRAYLRLVSDNFKLHVFLRECLKMAQLLWSFHCFFPCRTVSSSQRNPPHHSAKRSVVRSLGPARHSSVVNNNRINSEGFW